MSLKLSLLSVLSGVVFAACLVVAPTAAAAPEAALVGVAQVATGAYHSCAEMADGQVRCWGYNEDGQLGDGTNDDRERAVTVLNATGTGPLVDVTQVVVGEVHSCALLTSRQVRCWGHNGMGQLGDGSPPADASLPVVVSAPSGSGRLRDVTQLSAGSRHTCARLANGQLRCWGYNDDGQLGNDGTTDRPRPVPVKNSSGSGVLTGVTQVDAGVNHTCARLANGQARCWGSGPLGHGAVTSAHRPVVVRNESGSGPLTDVRQVSAGGTHSCARLTNGQARCWGFNADGELGNGTTDDAADPVVVSNRAGTGPLAGVTRIEAGDHSTCALVTVGGGQVRCWGDDELSQVGNGPPLADSSRPVTVKNLSGTGPLTEVAQLAHGSSHACVRLFGGQARCWGFGIEGGLGDGDNDDEPLPVRVTT